MTIALILISLVAFAVLAMRESPLWQWGAAVLFIGSQFKGYSSIGAACALIYGLGVIAIFALPKSERSEL